MVNKAHYVLVPLFYLGVLTAGRAFTAQGLGPWYDSLVKPPYTPGGGLIAAAWTVIYGLTAISLVLFINRSRGSRALLPVAALYVFNGAINALWSHVFFARHALGPAAAVAGAIALTVALMMAAAWRYSRTAGLMLLPYLLWSSFACYLTYDIYTLNQP